VPTSSIQTALAHQHHHNFYNCAAPKAKIAQNCHIIRQLQSDYPPYPSQLGCYGHVSSANASPQHRPTHLKVQVDVPTIVPPPDKLKKHPGILKNYKSCPVSPVHEELDWAVVQDRASQIKFNEFKPKRHTLYSDDAQTILDMIQSDTERMIAEITQKYGDLDEFVPAVGVESEKALMKHPSIDNKFTAKKEKHEHDFLSDEDGNFSSDSLEDCSLDLECDRKEKVMYMKKKKSSCKKHAKKQDPTPPKRSVSEYFIYEDYYTHVDINRKVSLSDILNDTSNENHKEQKFLETQRHSSASFFLGNCHERKSQESILSDDYSGAGGGAVSFCNSMESILSDESECKSAPLEALFERGKLGQKNIGYIERFDSNNSKSYGSSPNSNFCALDFYMQNRYQDDVKCDISNYGFDSLDGRSFKVLGATKSPTHRAVSTSFSVPLFGDDSMDYGDDFIPSMTSKVAHYNTNLNKSLSKDFANQRKQQGMHFEPTLPKPIIRSDIFSDAAVSSVSSTIVMKKSCSFEIDMGNGQRKIVQNSKKFEQNLQRFEKDRRDQQEQKQKLQKSDFNLEMDYVPHKPPPAHKRSSSMKGRGRLKYKEKFNTITCSQTTSALSQTQAQEVRDFVNRDYLNKMKCSQKTDEKSFEVYIAEKGVSEDDNMNSLDSLDSRKKKFDFENSMDSLELPPLPIAKRVEPTPMFAEIVDTRFITPADLGKFRDIEKKIDVINKLVELEEKKLEQERIRRENRIKPLFDGNTKERGFVKHLTKNFDKLAKSGHDNLDNWCLSPPSGSGMKRNFSLPDVLEGAKFQAFEFDDIDDPKMGYYEPSNMKLYDFGDDYETAGEGVENGFQVSYFFGCLVSKFFFSFQYLFARKHDEVV
jgi:mitogen-activated protein kinase binding protein 1